MFPYLNGELGEINVSLLNVRSVVSLLFKSDLSLTGIIIFKRTISGKRFKCFRLEVYSIVKNTNVDRALL